METSLVKHNLVPGLHHTEWINEEGSTIKEKIQRFGGFHVTETKEETRDRVRYYRRGVEGAVTRYGTSCQPPRRHIIAHPIQESIISSRRFRDVYHESKHSPYLQGATSPTVEYMTTTEYCGGGGGHRKAIMTKQVVAVPAPLIPGEMPAEPHRETQPLPWLHPKPRRFLLSDNDTRASPHQTPQHRRPQPRQYSHHPPNDLHPSKLTASPPSSPIHGNLGSKSHGNGNAPDRIDDGRMRKESTSNNNDAIHYPVRSDSHHHSAHGRNVFLRKRSSSSW